METTKAQPNILRPAPDICRELAFSLRRDAHPAAALKRLRDAFVATDGVAGIGEPLVRKLRAEIPVLRTFPALSGVGVAIPSAQHSLWIQLHGEDRGTLFDREVSLTALLADAFLLDDAIDLFRYRDGHDLSGYEDGTENPKGAEAIAAALVSTGEGLAGSSFVAVQRWVHDLAHFRAMNTDERHAIMGRHLQTNEELEDAPATAHVKRSAQESFDPPAFMVRRSMPWASAHEQGLEFVAYGESFDRYERVLRRMIGLEDGLVDGLFQISRPVSGAYYWCPPLADGRLDLRRLDV